MFARAQNFLIPFGTRKAERMLHVVRDGGRRVGDQKSYWNANLRGDSGHLSANKNHVVVAIVVVWWLLQVFAVIQAMSTIRVG